MNSSYPFSLSEMARIEYESVMVEERYSAGRRDYGTGDLLTHAEVHALAEVGAEPGITVLALAARTCRTKGAMSQLLAKLEGMGVRIARITLHVGLGTFRPVKAEEITEHVMHSEYYEVPREAASTINDARASGGRIISVGTTSTRTLESVADENGVIPATAGWTDIFIYPGYKFRAIDGLITNFHLPESTLIMLVSAFAGYEHTMHAYQEAVRERYRFFSFGDAMLII